MNPMNKREMRALTNTAHRAGLAAGAAVTPTPMIVQQRANPLDDDSRVVQQWRVNEGVCGFAWVNVKPGTSRFAKWLIAEGYAHRDSYYGGVSVWVSHFGQSHTRKVAYAQAFAATLRAAGIEAYANDRLD